MLSDKQINSLFTIIGCGSINKAATKLYISSSALIQQVNIIEEHLGFKIFKRNCKGVELTEAGKYFFDEIKIIQQKMTDILEKARNIEQTKLNKLTIGYINIIPENTVLDLYKQIKSRNNNISIYLLSLDASEVEGLIDKERVDCVLSLQQLEPNDKYYSFHIIQNKPYICVSPDSPLASKETISIYDLNDMHIIFPRRGKFTFSDKLEDYLRKHNINFTKLETDNYLEAEALVDNINTCRVGTYAVECSPLKYIPLKEDVYLDIYFVCKKEKLVWLKNNFIS